MLLLVLLGAGHLHVSAQVLPFDSYTVKDGLLSNDILCITQDAEGYLWVGTRDGISIFDGHQFNNLTAADGLPSNLIMEIAEDCTSDAKTMWFLGANGSLARWYRGRCVPFNYDSTLSWTRHITTLCMDRSGILWAGTEDTLIQIVQNTIRPVHVGVPAHFPHLIRQQGDSILWIASRSGLLRYEAATGIFTPIHLGAFKGKIINSLTFDDDGAVWAGVKEGYILRIEHTAIVGWRKTEPMSFLVRDKRGIFWFGNYKGLRRMTNPLLPQSRVEYLSTENGLSENTLREAFVDLEDNLWLGGITQGLVKLADDYVVKFPMKDINPQYQYSIGASDVNNHIWLVARSGLWEFWRTGEGLWHQAKHDALEGKGTAAPFPVFDIASTAREDVRPYSLFCTRDSILWIVFSNAQVVAYAVQAVRNGPSQLRKRWVLRTGIDIPHEFPKCMIVDRRGLLWYGIGDRIICVDPRRSRPFLRSFDSAPIASGKNYPRALFEDRSGNIWAGFLGGGAMCLRADSLQQGTFHPVPAPDRTASNAVAAICEDSLGEVWVASEGSGILEGNGKHMKRLTINHGLASNSILSLTTDRNRRIWIGSTNGISYVDDVESIVVVQPSTFLGEYCVQSGETRDGTLWFVGRSGLLLYRNGDAPVRVPQPIAHITSFQANGKELGTDQEPHLAYSENTCVVGFVAPTFRDPTQVRYQYRLTNVDTNWSVPQRQDRVTFAALPPGAYTFEVRTHVLGSLSPLRPASFHFSIGSPFWRKWWFAYAVWLALLATVAGVIRRLEKGKVLARMRALEIQHVINQERLRISRDMHDEVGSALTEITYLSEMARQKPDASRSYLQEISMRSSQVIDNVSEIVWAMNPHNDTLDNLLARLRRHAAKYLDSADIRCLVKMPEIVPPLYVPGEDRRDINLAVKEALHNVAKHSAATEVRLTVTLSGLSVDIIIRDNGCGYSVTREGAHGHGLVNMRNRLERMGGHCIVQSEAGHGTRVTFHFTAAKEQNT
jgi:signal transduction histidine kinase/ligand-binding sensor domain-containing protein